MSSALTDCLQFLEQETKTFISPCYSMKRAVLFLKDYQDKRIFLDKLIDYQEHIIKWAILNDRLSHYAISRLRKAGHIRDVAEQIARANLSQTALQLNPSCPDCYETWTDFLINC